MKKFSKCKQKSNISTDKKSSSKLGAEPTTKSSSKFGAEPATKSSSKSCAKPGIKSSSKSGAKLGATPTSKPGTKLSKVAPKNTTCAPLASTLPPTTIKTKKEKREEEWAKNVSTKIPVGRSFQTRDEFIKNGIPKSEYVDNPNIFYRRVFAVDTNQLDEMIVVKSTTSDKGKIIKDYNNKSKTRPFLHIEDNEGKKIKAGGKFVENPPSLDILENEAERIKQKAIKSPEDFEKLQKLKKRKKK